MEKGVKEAGRRGEWRVVVELSTVEGEGPPLSVFTPNKGRSGDRLDRVWGPSLDRGSWLIFRRVSEPLRDPH